MGRRRSSVADGLQAFSATYGLTKGIIDQSRAADAFKANSDVTESVSGNDAMQNFQDNYVPQEGGPETASEYLLQNPDVMKAMSPDRAASFSMGGATYNQAPTESQKMAAGLQGSQKYYAASGQADKAADMGLQASRSRVAELAVNEGERADKKAVSNEQELQKFHSVMQSFQDPKNAAAYIIDAYSKNLGNYGQGEHKDQAIQFEASPDGGGKAWTVDASGNATSAPQVFNKDQIVKEAQSAYWRNTDPAGYAKAIEARDARAAERQQENSDQNARIDRKGANDLKIAQMNIEGRKEVAGLRSGAGGSRGGAGGGDSSKGAKFDIDGDGNRVILYRNGTMVYPKDADGAPVKIKSGTDQDQKYVRDMTKIFAGKSGIAPDDPVAAAQGLMSRTKTGAPPAVTSGAPASALEYLKSNPAAAPQFQQKYGYLPKGY